MAPSLSSLQSALAKLDAGGADQSVTMDSPIFVAGSLWRSGSTLLQRVIMSDPRVLIWGEPFEDKALVERMAEGLSTPGHGLSFWAGERCLGNLHASWTTLLWPDAFDVKAGFRALFDTWFAAPALRRGFQRWGIKEVRWSGADIAFLRWLYPKSEVFLIARSPVDAYRSLLNYTYREGEGYYVRWPERHVHDAKSYAVHWAEMIESWLLLSQSGNYNFIGYDALAAGEVDFRSMSGVSQLNIDQEAALSVKVNAGFADVLQRSTTKEDEQIILEITRDARHRLDGLLSSS